MRALLLDIGNSRVKWGVLENGRIRRTGHIAQRDIADRGPGALTATLPREVDTVFASNVAGTSFATRLAGVIGLHCNRDIRFAQVEKSAFGVTNSYRQPRRMGVDRWVAMIGAWAEVQAACLVVDAGTAVTLDALDASGQHLGGQILPGLGLMAESLARRTSDLPPTRPRAAAEGLGIFAGSTARAIEQGVLNAVTGAVERALRILRDNESEVDIILTGGDASAILKSLGGEAKHRPHLVLSGLAHMLENRQ